MLRWLGSLSLTFGLLACGSDPLQKPDEEGEAGASDGGAGRGGSGGRAGSSGAGGSRAGGSGASGSGGAAPNVPDYTTSPCYGSTAETEVYDFETHVTTRVSATCRGEGNRTLFYVADELWETEYAPGAPPFTQVDVNTFLYGYELAGRATSSQPELGVLPLDELVFGPLDEAGLTNGKLPIFLIDSGGAGDGYLCSWCEKLELHLDGPVLRTLRTELALSIAAHESVHAIHRGFDPNEALWVDETLAEAAMTVNGFFTDEAWMRSFLADTNQSWGPGLSDAPDFNYGAGLLFGTYLWERGGAELLGAITQDARNEWAGIDAALTATGHAQNGLGMFLDMATAAALDDEASGYWFRSFDLAAAVEPSPVATGTTHAATVEEYGLVYLALAGDARSVTLAAEDEIHARLVLSGEPAELLELPADEAVTFDRPARLLVLTAPARTQLSVSVR
jgi:hypothetical protein